MLERDRTWRGMETPGSPAVPRCCFQITVPRPELPLGPERIQIHGMRGTKGHLSPCAAAPGTHWRLRLETFTSPGGGSRVIGTERAQGCPGLWSLRGGFL